jgi:molybdopterin-biosynthesis enzyme MoeA-like protein
MALGLIIIGDEILSGKRQDKHFAKVLELVSARGMELAWVRYLGDDRARIVSTLRDTFASGDTVVSCGGIGATPDDHTRQAAAEALGVELMLHPEAAELIRLRAAEMAREGKAPADPAAPENRQRLKMGEFPVGARIIPNPYNRIPGFAIQKHYFVPGFPVMAWPMIEALLDGELADERPESERAEQSFLVYELAESTITPLMEAVERELPGVRTFSLPSVGEDGSRRHIELGAKGSVEQVVEALARLRQGAIALGGQVSS